jgi:hypothetical protein
MAIQEYQQKPIAVLNDYPAEKYNLLIPVQTIQEISPLHKVIVNVVNIDSNPERGKDVYKQKEGEFALTKKGLNRLMAGANVQVIDSRSVMPQKCARCMEIVRQTKSAPRCGDCPSGDDVACQMTIAIPEPSGTWRMVRATKEIRIVDERAAMKEAQFKQFFPFRTEHCETKALNRALRAGLMVKSTYTAKELEKPFAVALVVPNMADPEMRKAAAERYASSSTALFPNQAPKLPENAGMISPQGIIDISADEPDDEQPTGGDNPPWANDLPSTQGVFCEGCGQKIEAVEDWSAERVSEYALRTYGKTLCPDCCNKRKAQQDGGHR